MAEHKLVRMTLYLMSCEGDYDTMNIKGALQHMPVLYRIDDKVERTFKIEEDDFDDHELNNDSVWDSRERLDELLSGSGD